MRRKHVDLGRFKCRRKLVLTVILMMSVTVYILSFMLVPQEVIGNPWQWSNERQKLQNSYKTSDSRFNFSIFSVNSNASTDHNLFLDDENWFDTNKDFQTKNQRLQMENRNKTKRLPKAVIIGVKKAGTRALLEYLRLHPDVRAPGPEPHFFDKNFHKGLNWYRDLMPETKRGQLTIEKTPSYFVTKGVPERVYRMSKKTKFIVVFRDPVTRAISDYTQLVSRNPNVRPFEEMVYVDNRTKIINTSWTIVKIGIYAQHLLRWLEYFPIKQFHFVSGERLIKDPGNEMIKVQKFLGLETYITSENFTFNQTKGFPCYRKGQKNFKWHCLNEEKGRRHPVINSIVRKHLEDFYRPFNVKLYSMTGQKYGWS